MAAAVILSNRVRRSWRPPTYQSNTALHFTNRLSSEIIRKLQIATETKTDSEFVCEDVFVDIIGTVGVRTREVLELHEPCCFYEVLAEYYKQSPMDSEKLLENCRLLWSQNFVVPIYTLLLHKWILTDVQSGGEMEHNKYLNLLLNGAQQLFWTDLVSCTCHFGKLFDFLYSSFHSNVMSEMTGSIHSSYLALLASFMPYYLPLGDFSSAVFNFPYKKSEVDGFTTDDFFTQITETLRRFGGRDPGLVVYLRAISELKKCPVLSEMKLVTNLRLQGQLYSLTSPGGPRYACNEVRRSAFSALDALCPAGSRTRKLTSQLFRILHPLDWPRTTMTVIKPIWNHSIGLVFWILASIVFLCKWLMKKRV
eukprot:g3751.t1